MERLNSFKFDEGQSTQTLPQKPSPMLLLTDSRPRQKDEVLRVQEPDNDIKLKTEEEDEKADKNNCSKEFLKFSRKLANLMTQHLQQKTDVLMKFISYSGSVISVIYGISGLTAPNLSELVTIQIECLEKLWGSYKEMISYSKNKKICIVKSEDWSRLYSKSDFRTAVKELVVNTKTKFSSLDLSLMCQIENIFEFFSSTLYYVNLIFSFMMIQKDQSDKGKYLRELKTIENFLVMMLSADLYKNYNHRSGKFAIECCGKCKVCRSKNISPSFQLQLERGRTKSDLMKTFISISITDLANVSDDTIFNFFNLTATYI